jgi:hypothetical protein
LNTRVLIWQVDRSHIVWCHDHRNEQYHGGNKGTPEKTVLALIRKAALWIFGTLFEVMDPEQLLEQAIAENAPPSPPQRDRIYDRAIDRQYGMIEIGEQSFYSSEVLFFADYGAYRDAGARLCQIRAKDDGDEAPE